MLSSIHERFEEPGAAEKPYPFHGDLGRLLPWWGQLEEARESGARSFFS